MPTQNLNLSAQVTTTSVSQTITALFSSAGTAINYTQPTSGVAIGNIGAGTAQYRIDNGEWIVLDKGESNYLPVDLSVNRVLVKLINDGATTTQLDILVESLPSAYIGPSGELFPVANPPVRVNGYRYSGAVATAVPGVGYSFTTGQWFRNGVAISGQTAVTYTRTDADIGAALSFTATNIPFNASAGVTLPTVVGPVDPGTLRQVATSTFINTFQHGVNKQANSRSPHYMRADSSTVQIVIPNWLVTGQVETNGNGTDTWTGSLEYPAGTFTQITFGGNVSGAVAPGNNLISDAVLAPPKDAKFWIRLFVNSTGNIKFQQYYAGDGTAQLEAGVSGLTDKTMGGTMTTAASKDAGMIMPCAIIANSTVPAVMLPGDSIDVGRGDTATAGVPLQGHLGRSFGLSYPIGNVGVSGDQISAFLASNSKRIALAAYFTHVAANFGINDVSAGRSAAQVQADTNSFISLFGSRPVAICTMSPVSTGTWTTVAGQTTVAGNPVRAAVNTQRLTNLPLAKVVYDVNPIVENVTNPEDGLWNITGGPNTDDGTHHNANSATRIAASINPALLVA